MRKLAVVSCVAVALATGCGSPGAPPEAAPANAEVRTPFDEQYRAASEEFGVPYELLRGMGAAQTGHHSIDPAQSESGQAGVMGLPPDSIAEAARLLHLSEETVASDPLANIRGAAALVLDRRLRGETWNGAALEAAGHTNEFVRSRWLQKLARHLKAAGELVPEEPAGSLGSAATAGDYPASSFVSANSGNYTNASRGTADVHFIVIHDVEGSYEGCISWFQNPNANVSAHYVVADEGDITQMVWEQDIAWHAGNWSYNQQSVGIEHEGYANDPGSYPETMYVASAALTRYLTDKYSIPRTRDYVIAHKDVPGSTHVDPGPYWQWDHYMELVESGGIPVKAKLVGFVREGDIYEGPGIAGATVTLGDGTTATTDADGYYEIADLDPGLYTLTAAAEGYEPSTDEKNIETPGGTWWKSFALVPQSASGDDDDGGMTPGSKGSHGAHGGGTGCSVAPSGTASPATASIALLALAGLALRRRHV